jgi:microcystin-dependent protein
MTGNDKFINVFVNTNPVGATDPKSQGDDHLRGIKNVLLNTFPNIAGAVTASHAELSILDGVTADKDEINFLDGALAGTQVASKAVVADSNTNTGVSKVTQLHVGASGSEVQMTSEATNSAPMIRDSSGRVKVTDLLNSAGASLLTPTGSVLMWATSSAPSGWLELDGSAVSRTTYADLFAVISDDYGNGDGSTTFNLPDMRGQFARGWDNTAGTDPDATGRTDRGDGTTGDNVGTKQGHALEVHSHTSSVNMQTFPGSGGTINEDAGTTVKNQNLSAVIDGTTGATTSANETRPTNIGLMFIIKI